MNQDLLEKANSLSKNTLLEVFQISFIEVGENYLIAKMPVSQAVCQPDGILHGGASAALAETAGSMASLLFAPEGMMVRGIDIYMNHTGTVALGGCVFVKAECLHKGRTLQHWDIKITDENNKLISYGKHTTITIPKK
ncbi:MAG: PaaI family thioesterase [Capnocytophaga sp.]|nr:PaaI family thioesterase [Capnocytophaga sp.]